MPASTVTVPSSRSRTRSRCSVETSIPSESATRLNEWRVPSGFSRSEAATSSCASSTLRGETRWGVEYVRLPAQFFIGRGSLRWTRPSRSTSRDGLHPDLRSAHGLHFRSAFAPARSQRIEHDHAQGQRGERPERVLAVAQEAQLGDEVQGDNHDRGPPCRFLPGKQAVAHKDE